MTRKTSPTPPKEGIEETSPTPPKEGIATAGLSHQTPPNLPKGEAFRGSGTPDSPSFGGVGEVLIEEGKPGYVTANPYNYRFVKEVRNILKEQPTEAEKVIWEYLRNRKTAYSRFESVS